MTATAQAPACISGAINACRYGETETYTAMACPPNVNRMLVAPVKNCWGSRGPACVTPGCCPSCTAVPIMYQAVKVVATNPKKEKAR